MNQRDVFRRCLVSAVLSIGYGCTWVDAAPRAAYRAKEPHAADLKRLKQPQPTMGYVRPFGPNAPWNRPVKGLPRHPQSGVLAERLWKFGPSRAGNFNLSFSGYTYPVYTVASTTTSATVQAGMGNLNGTRIPWSSDWVPATGSDGQVIILDPANGREWDLWQVNVSGSRVRISNGNLVPGSYLTKEDGFKPSRGCGIPYLAMLVRPEEIAQGKIEHALSMPSRNTAKNFVAPATKSDGRVTRNGMPMGTRFALNITEAEIDEWVNSLPSELSGGQVPILL